MEWTAIPVMLDDIAPLDFTAAQYWCDKNILSSDMSFEDELVPVLCMAFGVLEQELRIHVRDEFLNKRSFAYTTVQRWMETATLTESQLLRQYSTLGLKVDGLFIWLATIAMCLHLNYVHSNGIWMSCASESPDMYDVLVVFTETHFLMSKTHHNPATKMQIKDGFCDPEDTRNCFVSKPMVL